MAQQEPEIRKITRDELLEARRRSEPIILVDVLGHDHFLQMHLPGAINIPLPVLRDMAPMVLGTQDAIIVYCASFECTASPTAARILMQLGYTNVREYAGGLQDWLDGKQPVMHVSETPPEARAA